MSNGEHNFNTLDQFITPEGGVLLVDKFPDWTSFDVVKKVRSLLQVKKVGHAGTLDPNATGLLILCSNSKTKDIDIYQAQEKEYSGVCVFGATTPSYDAATRITSTRSIDDLTPDRIYGAIKKFMGEIEQLPPMYSAVKINGQRLYNLARKGLDIERKPRTVTISSFTIHNIDIPEMHFTVTCSKGTYIRSLVHDLGQDLGCGAYLKSLRRTRIGQYGVEDAWTIEKISLRWNTKQSVVDAAH